MAKGQRDALAAAASLLGQRGGHARAERLAPEERSRIGRMGAKARAERLTPAELRRIARMGAVARIVKHGETPRKASTREAVRAAKMNGKRRVKSGTA
jgi:hypothetical protein